MRKQIIFGGCGGMYHYMAGIAKVIQEELREYAARSGRKVEDCDEISYGGISGGCFPSMFLALDMNIEDVFENMNRPFLKEVGSYRTGALFRYNQTARKWILDIMPDDAYQRLSKNDRFRASTTVIPRLKNELLCNWTSNEDVVDGLLCSSYIPLFEFGLWKNYRKNKYVDGGVSDYHGASFHEEGVKTMHISIRRWRTVNPTWFWCWTCDKWATQLFEWGVEDARKHLAEIQEFFYGHADLKCELGPCMIEDSDDVELNMERAFEMLFVQDEIDSFKGLFTKVFE